MSVEQNILCGIRSGDKAEKRRVLAETQIAMLPP